MWRLTAAWRRAAQGEVVYTYVGDIVVSVNPFKNTGCVGKEIRKRYKGGKAASLPPHIYALVDATFNQAMPARCRLPLFALCTRAPRQLVTK